MPLTSLLQQGLGCSHVRLVFPGFTRGLFSCPYSLIPTHVSTSVLKDS